MLYGIWILLSLSRAMLGAYIKSDRVLRSHERKKRNLSHTWPGIASARHCCRGLSRRRMSGRAVGRGEEGPLGPRYDRLEISVPPFAHIGTKITSRLGRAIAVKAEERERKSGSDRKSEAIYMIIIVFDFFFLQRERPLIISSLDWPKWRI